MKAIDCLGEEKNTEFLLDQLCDNIEEVRTSHVVQVVTDVAPVCKVAGMLVQKRQTNILDTMLCAFIE